MADNCLFCKMVSGEIKPSLVYDDADVMAFNDLNPQAPLPVVGIAGVEVHTVGASVQNRPALRPVFVDDNFDRSLPGEKGVPVREEGPTAHEKGR